MSVLEKAVSNLAEALETLETRLEEKTEEQAADREALAALRGRAAAAAKHTREAGQGVTAAISDVEALLSRDYTGEAN